MSRLEPNVLKNLPITSSRTSQNFYPLFFFIPIAPRIFDCSVRESLSFANYVGGRAQQAFETAC